MAVIKNSVQIERSLEDVFDYLVDLRNELEWNPDAQSMEKITEGPVGVGTKFLAKWKQSELLEVECVKFNRPHRWSHVNGGPLLVFFDATVTPLGVGSMITVHFDARPKGLLKLAFPLLLQVLKRAEKRNMLCIKQALEKRGAITG
ncbi:MAG: SRPBCC family protein [Deinococcota bacterium]|nr:SRPBCC family protein [Deinococcota bacterium]